MKNFKHGRRDEPDRELEDRWGHPLLAFSRFLGGIGFWIVHAFIVVSICGFLVLDMFDVPVNEAIGTLAMMTLGIALLFAFAGWVARCGR